MSSHDSSTAGTTAEQSAAVPLEEAIHSNLAETLNAAASDPALNQDLALALLKRRDLPADVLEKISKNGAAMKSRRVKLALATHPATPRHASMPLIRQLFTFDLMKVALAPVVPGDIKRAADEALIHRLETISLGEKSSLGRRASGRVAGALLLDAEPRVMKAALENPRLTESPIIQGLTKQEAPAAFVQAICQHAKWSMRREVRIALLRNEKTPMRFALEFARALPVTVVRELLQNSHLPANIKSYLKKDLAARE
jgi:hypothetical protein